MKINLMFYFLSIATRKTLITHVFLCLADGADLALLPRPSASGHQTPAAPEHPKLKPMPTGSCDVAPESFTLLALSSQPCFLVTLLSSNTISR